MPKKCFIENCKLQQDDPGCLNLNFFKVPKDPKRRQQWQKSIDDHFNSGRVFKDYSCVCALHFEDACFNNDATSVRVTLKKTAIPTIFTDYEYEPTDRHVPSGPMRLSNDQHTVDDFENEIAPQSNITSVDKNVKCSEEQPMNCVENGSKNEKATSLPQTYSARIFRKSIANLDLDAINLDNKLLILSLLKNAQNEIEGLRKSNRAKNAKLYRLNKRMKKFGLKKLGDKRLDTTIIDFANPDFYGPGTCKKYIDNVVGLIAGVVTRKILIRTKCFSCSLILTNEVSHSALLERRNRCGLIRPSLDIFRLCQILERIFRVKYNSKRGSFSDMCQYMSSVVPEDLLPIDHSENPSRHRSQLIKSVIIKYFQIRWKKIESVQTEKKKRARRKITKVILNYYY